MQPEEQTSCVWRDGYIVRPIAGVHRADVIHPVGRCQIRVSLQDISRGIVRRPHEVDLTAGKPDAQHRN